MAERAEEYTYIQLIRQLDRRHKLDTNAWRQLLGMMDASRGGQGTVCAEIKKRVADYAAKLARKRSLEVFGSRIYTRGLIEISNYCKNNCFYCGIRRGNEEVKRYRLKPEEILRCAETGYGLGFRTFVLQGGEDFFFTDELLCRLLEKLKKNFPDCAITLSLGERGKESYQALFDAGADRYLLRHETADRVHYQKLHPAGMDFDNRIQCLRWLKDIGYQVGCGFMVGSPGQTVDTLVQDMELITDLQPAMVGIGPFVPHHRTPFGSEAPGTVEQTLFFLSLLRILKPDLLLPATTALATIDEQGREKGILAGANVLMPNLSPEDCRSRYELYDNKRCGGDEGAEGRAELEKRMEAIGYTLAVDRGDAPEWISCNRC